MLIIDGNSVYEIDCDCARRHGLYLNKINRESEGKRETIHADTGSRCIEKPVYTGEGVTVAVLDTGIYPHPDFGDRIVGWYDAVSHSKEPSDPNGHGTQEAVTVLL